MWKCWLKLFSFVEYIILTLNCNESMCLVIEGPLQGHTYVPGLNFKRSHFTYWKGGHVAVDIWLLSIFDYCRYLTIVTISTHVYVVQWWIQGPPLIFRPNWGLQGQKKFFWDLAPLYMKAWICRCRLLPFLLCYSVYCKVSFLFTSVPLFLIPKKNTRHFIPRI